MDVVDRNGNVVEITSPCNCPVGAKRGFDPIANADYTHDKDCEVVRRRMAVCGLERSCPPYYLPRVLARERILLP